jgi:hypoxanthine phosphoribosyltransferase
MMTKADHDLNQDIAQVLIDEKKLQERIRELGKIVKEEYKDEDDLLLICVLKGAFMFLADITRALDRPHELDFMGVSSYGASTESSGAVRIVLDLKQDIGGRNVLIVEDIIDSGRTLDYLRRILLARSPASLRILTLLDKPERREVDVPVDYTGFHIPNEFVVGYGLDFAEIYRNLPYIAVLKQEIFAHLIE